MTSNQDSEHPGTPAHVPPGSIEIGDVHVDGDHLTASLGLVVCGRAENLILFVESLGDEIGVEVRDAILDFSALTVVAGHVVAKLNTVAGRAALKLAAAGVPQNWRQGPQVRVMLNWPGGTSNG